MPCSSILPIREHTCMHATKSNQVKSQPHRKAPYSSHGFDCLIMHTYFCNPRSSFLLLIDTRRPSPTHLTPTPPVFSLAQQGRKPRRYILAWGIGCGGNHTVVSLGVVVVRYIFAALTGVDGERLVQTASLHLLWCPGDWFSGYA